MPITKLSLWRRLAPELSPIAALIAIVATFSGAVGYIWSLREDVSELRTDVSELRTQLDAIASGEFTLKSLRSRNVTIVDSSGIDRIDLNTLGKAATINIQDSPGVTRMQLTATPNASVAAKLFVSSPNDKLPHEKARRFLMLNDDGKPDDYNLWKYEGPKPKQPNES